MDEREPTTPMSWPDAFRKLRFALQRRLLAASPRTRWRNLRFRRRASLEPALPPERLLVQVAGSADLEWFIHGGRLAFQSIADTLEEQGLSLAGFETVLDFGCGCGRVLRHWPRAADLSLYGSDVDPALISWCGSHLPIARFTANNPEPPLNFGDATFDFIYALSVFTHLPERLQIAWIDELTRILKPGGLLLITLHGAHYLPELEPDERKQFLDGRLVVRNAAMPGSNLCAAFHPNRFIRERLARRIELLAHRPAAAAGNPYQDIVLFRKPAAGS